MATQAAETRPDIPDRIRALGERYVAEACGDVEMALHLALYDALADLCTAQRERLEAERRVSAGYVRRGRARPDA
jgi:hypothetical protein